MANPAAKRNLPLHLAAACVCAAVGIVLFHFFGSAVRGYVNTPSLFWWWASQWLDPQADAEHGWLVLALSAWLLVRNVRMRGAEGAEARGAGGDHETQTAEGKSGADSTPGRVGFSGSPSNVTAHSSPLTSAALALLAGLGLHVVGFAAQQGRISILALLLFTWGVLRLAGGPRWGRAAAFPVAFMVFAIPLNALDSIGFWLRVWVVDASGAIARGSGIAVLQNGTQLVAPDGTYNYDVAAACSGIRSLTAMAALSLLAGYLNFTGWWRRALVLLLCFPLVYIGNVARILAIIFAAEAGGPRWGDIAHEVMGYGIFAIVLGGVLAGIATLRHFAPEEGARHEARGTGAGERRQAEGGVPEAQTRPAGDDRRAGERRGASEVRTRARVGWVAGAVIAVALGEMIFLHRLATLPPRGQVGVALTDDGRHPVELPTFLGIEWTGQTQAVSQAERDILPADTGYSRKLYFNHRDPSKQVFLSIVLSGRDRTSIHRPELCLVGQGWTVGDPRQVSFQDPAGEAFRASVLPVTREVQTPQGKRAVPQLVVYWFVTADAIAPTHLQMFLRDAWNRVTRARADRWAYVLVQTDAVDGEAAALARIQAVLNGTLPTFQRAAAR
jgi:EpsI family protein